MYSYYKQSFPVVVHPPVLSQAVIDFEALAAASVNSTRDKERSISPSTPSPTLLSSSNHMNGVVGMMSLPTAAASTPSVRSSSSMQQPSSLSSLRSAPPASSSSSFIIGGSSSSFAPIHAPVAVATSSLL
jgi:hypothetical protein